MVNYLEIIANMMKQPHYLLVILITIYAVAGTIDFVIGSISAGKENFSSRISQLGIVRKLVTIAVMVLVVPLALMLPLEVGIYSLSILYIGIVLSEIYSVLGHVGLVKDGNKHQGLVGNLFTELIDKLFSANKLNK